MQSGAVRGVRRAPWLGGLGPGRRWFDGGERRVLDHGEYMDFGVELWFRRLELQLLGKCCTEGQSVVDSVFYFRPSSAIAASPDAGHPRLAETRPRRCSESSLRCPGYELSSGHGLTVVAPPTRVPCQQGRSACDPLHLQCEDRSESLFSHPLRKAWSQPDPSPAS